MGIFALALTHPQVADLYQVAVQEQSRQLCVEWGSQTGRGEGDGCRCGPKTPLKTKRAAIVRERMTPAP
jgi:hypothetical protein